jgi:hypothetical protein
VNALKEAGDPHTSPGRLRALAEHDDVEVRRAVAQNPSTPPETLSTLGASFPGELLQNPAFALWELEGPELFQALPVETARALLEVPGLAARYFVLLAAHPEGVIQRMLASHPQAPPALLEALARDEDYLVRRWALHNIVRRWPMPDEALPREVLTRLIRVADEDVRVAFAKSASTPRELLVHLARDEEWGVRKAVVENEATSPEALTHLARDREWSVRRAVAGNKATPKKVLVLLTRDLSKKVREAAAKALKRREERA